MCSFGYVLFEILLMGDVFTNGWRHARVVHLTVVPVLCDVLVVSVGYVGDDVSEVLVTRQDRSWNLSFVADINVIRNWAESNRGLHACVFQGRHSSSNFSPRGNKR